MRIDEIFGALEAAPERDEWLRDIAKGIMDDLKPMIPRLAASLEEQAVNQAGPRHFQKDVQVREEIEYRVPRSEVQLGTHREYLQDLSLKIVLLFGGDEEVSGPESAGGGYMRPGYTGDGRYQIVLYGGETPWQASLQDWKWKLETLLVSDTMLHELTHALDYERAPALRRRGRKDYRDGSKKIFGTKRWGDYYNDPAELNARAQEAMREYVLQLRAWSLGRYDRPGGGEHTEQHLRQIRFEDTLDLVSPGGPTRHALSVFREKNRKRLLARLAQLFEHERNKAIQVAREKAGFEEEPPARQALKAQREARAKRALEEGGSLRAYLCSRTPPGEDLHPGCDVLGPGFLMFTEPEAAQFRCNAKGVTFYMYRVMLKTNTWNHYPKEVLDEAFEALGAFVNSVTGRDRKYVSVRDLCGGTAMGGKHMLPYTDEALTKVPWTMEYERLPGGVYEISVWDPDAFEIENVREYVGQGR